MAKKLNPILQIKELEKENKLLRESIIELHGAVEHMKGFTLQQSLDMAVITLHREFGFGPDRCMKFKNKFHDMFIWYAQLCVDDSKADKEIDYTKASVDAVLQEAYGTPQDFDKRYAPENLYFRGRDLKEEEA